MMKNGSATATTKKFINNSRESHYSGYPKPAYSNACLIALGMCVNLNDTKMYQTSLGTLHIGHIIIESAFILQL